MKNCPACQKPMTEADFGGIAVDVCESGCRGLWFDWSELARVQKGSGELSSALQEALQAARTPDEDRGPIRCPQCNVPLHRHVYKMVKGVNIDECYTCGGFFLDPGELKAIRETQLSRADQDRYCSQLVSAIPETHKNELNLAKQQIRANAIRAWAYAAMPVPSW